MRCRSLLFLICLIIGSFHLSANDSFQRTKDSLLNLIETLPNDTTRLEALHSLIVLTQTSPDVFKYEEQLFNEAFMQKDLDYQCFAIQGLVIYYFNNKDRNNLAKWVRKMEEVALPADYYNAYFEAKYWAIELRFEFDEIELGLYEARKMAVEAKKYDNIQGQMQANLCLVTGYLVSDRVEEAIESADRARALLLDSLPFTTQINVLVRLAEIYAANNRNERFFSCTSQLGGIIEKTLIMNPSLRGGYDNLFAMIESNYVEYYLRTKQWTLAHNHLRVIEDNYSNAMAATTQRQFLKQNVDYYIALADYDKALQYVDSALVLLDERKTSQAVSLLTRKANILVASGGFNEAFPLYQEVIATKDSLAKDNSQHQMEQIQKIYQWDQLKLEEEELKANIQFIILLVIGCVIFLLVGFAIRSYSLHKKLRSAETETRNATKVIEDTNDMKTRFLTNMSYNIRTSLNNVVGFSQLITEKNSDLTTEERRSCLNTIQKDAAELIQLVNEILDLSRLEAGMMKFNLQTADIVLLCSEVIAQVEYKTDRQIQVDFLSEIDAKDVEMDTMRMGQVLQSLLMGSEECEKSLRVSLSIACTDKEILFTISNSPLTNSQYTSQRVNIRHEINRLFIKRFGGTYQVEMDTNVKVVFTYPYSIS